MAEWSHHDGTVRDPGGGYCPEHASGACALDRGPRLARGRARGPGGSPTAGTSADRAHADLGRGGVGRGAGWLPSPWVRGSRPAGTLDRRRRRRRPPHRFRPNGRPRRWRRRPPKPRFAPRRAVAPAAVVAPVAAQTKAADVVGAVEGCDTQLIQGRPGACRPRRAPAPSPPIRPTPPSPSRSRMRSTLTAALPRPRTGRIAPSRSTQKSAEAYLLIARAEVASGRSRRGPHRLPALSRARARVAGTRPKHGPRYRPAPARSSTHSSWRPQSEQAPLTSGAAVPQAGQGASVVSGRATKGWSSATVPSRNASSRQRS